MAGDGAPFSSVGAKRCRTLSIYPGMVSETLCCCLLNFMVKPI